MLLFTMNIPIDSIVSHLGESTTFGYQWISRNWMSKSVALQSNMASRGIPCQWISMVILDGGAIAILKNMKVNGKDDIPYMTWNIENV